MKTTDPTRCCEQVRDDGRWPSYHQCKRKHVVTRDGKSYCAIHDPKKVQEKTIALHAKWDREWADKARATRLNAAAPALLTAAKALINLDLSCELNISANAGEVPCDCDTCLAATMAHAAIAAAEQP